MKSIARPLQMQLIVFAIALSTYFTSSASAQTTATLQTSDTIIHVRADKNAPRLLSISDLANGIWTNNTQVPLIEFVYLSAGQSDSSSEFQKCPVHWRFNDTLSHRDSQRVSFVYDSESPNLRLTWKWSVTADFGP